MNITALFKKAITPGTSAITAPATVGRQPQGRSLWLLVLPVLFAVCEPAQAQTNSPATGMPAVTYASSSITAPTEDSAITAAQGTIADTDGVGTLSWQWSQADTNGGTYTAIDMATNAAFTPLQAHVGMFLQVCASFMDMASTPNEEERCLQIATAVANVNDAPVGLPNTIYVPAGGNYTFSVADFPFTDEDGDSLVIAGVGTPTKGTFTFNGSPFATANTDFTLDRLAGAVGYRPPSDAGPMAGYATFEWAPTTKDITAGNTGSPPVLITIDLVSTTASAAMGAPAVTAATGTAYNEDVELTAGMGTVADANGTPTHTRTWQWQSAPAPASGTPAASAYGPIAGATDATFTPTQTHVGQYIRACLSFTDGIGTAEGPLCSAGTIIAAVNDIPTSADASVDVPISATAANPYIFKTADFPFMDADTGAALASITIVTTATAGTFRNGNTAVTANTPVTAAALRNGDLSFHPPANSAAADRFATFTFSVNDGSADSATHTMTINLVPPNNIDPKEAVAVFNAAAAASATNAIMGAMSASPAATTFGLSLDGTSLMDTARTMGQSTTTDTDGRTAWFHGTTAANEYNAAYNASDNSAESLRHRLQSMADGDIAMNWQAGGSGMRFWARYQSMDISGNEDAALEYDGSGTGFYLGADRQITDKMRLGLAISSDSADITIDLDDDKMDDEASRSATTLYPYLHIDMGNNNQARIIAGIGSGDLDIKSSANNNDTTSAALSWNMLAASISHHRPMKGKLSARFDGSFQLGSSSTDAANFSGGSTLAASDASTNEIAVNAELRYRNNNFTPFASLSGRKLGGDLSQSLAMDLGLGADLQTGPAIIRLSITRQLNDTTHKRDTLSLDIATTPNQSGLSASLGSRYDSLSGKPQWQGTVRWHRRAAELSLAASQSDCRLQARLLW